MSFIKTTLENVIKAPRIVTIHYFEYAKDYVFEGERHDFWEFLYVDKGEVEVTADTQGYVLKQGDIIFHKPNEFHSVWANGVVAPNLMVVSFECSSDCMDYFHNRIVSIGDPEKRLLTNIMREGHNAFSLEFNNPNMKQLRRKEDATFGAEQLIHIYLEQLLITMIRTDLVSQKSQRLSTMALERAKKDITTKVILFMQNRIRTSLKFDDILKEFQLSSTQLKTIFKANIGDSVMGYFRKLKIDLAKKLIREGQYNFTEISDYLDYSSVHYFSKQFKAITGMTPSEYSRSIKARL